MTTVSAEHLEEIQTLRNTFLEIVTTLGELHLTKLVTANQLKAIEKNIAEQEEQFSEFQEKERVLFNRLQEVYGAGSINMETGEITV